MSLVRELDHFTINTLALDDTIAFFEDVLGLENRPEDRPDFPVPGAWLWSGDRAVIHLVGVEPKPGASRGAFDHVAFATDDFDALVERLASRDIKHQVAAQQGTGLRQVFFREPNGVRIEVTCPE